MGSYTSSVTSKKERIEEIKEDLRRWNSEGYDLEPIYDSLRNKDVKKFVELYKKYKRLIPEMKRYEAMLRNHTDPEAQRYMSMLKDPLKFEEHIDEIAEVVSRKKEIEESEDEIFSLIAGVKSEEVQSGLNPNFTFENYIVHDGNELAHTAARKVIESPGSINPLMIIGESGTGKTHLLNAIGNEYSKRGISVIYKNAEEIILKKEVIYDTKVLLIDDFHLLLEREDMHPLLNLLFENYMKEEKQIILASNFRLSYYAIEPSLRTKLESGISVELKNPDENARLRILRLKVNEMNVNIDDEVIFYLSKNMRNMSRLISAIKKIVAFSRILGEKPSISMAADIIKSRISLQPGVAYLVEEEKPYRSVAYIKETVDRGYSCTVITRMNPNRFSKLYNLSGDIYWLTEHSTTLKSVPPILENINYFVESLINKHNIMYIDGLDFLMSKNSPDSVIQFIRHIVDIISETNAIIVFSLNPKTIEERYVKIMERELELA